MAGMIRKAVCIGLLSSALTAPGYAQSPDAAPQASVQDIIVSARKQDERLQTVPVSITALTASDLTAKSLNDLSDLAQSVPNLNFARTPQGGASASLLSIRGIGQNDVLITNDPGVGLYIDNIYLGRAQGIDLDMMDVERVEVLRGPQGTLFGKNTIGGAVNVVTRRPDPSGDLSGRITGSIGSFSRRNLTVNLNAPIVTDRFAISAAAAIRDDDGYGRRVTTGEPMGDTGRFSARLTARYIATDALSFTASVDRTRIDEHNSVHYLSEVGAPPLVQLLNARISPPYDARWIPADPYESFATGPNLNRATVWGSSFVGEWDAGGVTLKSISSYRSLKSRNELDVSGAPIVILNYFDHVRQKQWSQEFQASGSSFDDRLKWTGGLYYFRETARQTRTNIVFPVLVPVVGDISFVQFNSVRNNSYAAYAQGTYELLPRLRLTGGLRYTEEKKFASDAVNFFISGAVKMPYTTRKASFHALSPRVGLDYQMAPEAMVYVSAAQGFRSGGFNGRAQTVAQFNEFDPEKNWTYEAGLRSELLDRKLRFNATAFYTRYRDIQVSTVLGTVSGAPTNIIANAASAEIKGGEIEVVAAPARTLTLTANLGYSRPRYTSVLVPPSGIPPVTPRTRFVFAPELTYMLAAENRFDLGSDYQLSVRADYNYRSKIYSELSNTPRTTQKGYGLLNARVTLQTVPARWQLAAFVTNITDKRYFYGGVDSSQTIGFVDLQLGRPREWGVEASFRF